MGIGCWLFEIETQTSGSGSKAKNALRIALSKLLKLF